jgi:CheY-like chemotaxis protein
LVISKQLTELMNGTLSVESTENVGTRVNISLPLEISHLDFNSYEQSELLKSVDEKLSQKLQNATILIVDDIPANRLILEMVIEKTQARSVLTANGKEALDALEENEIDLIFMDIHMPEMDGYEATKIIRKSSKFATIPIIAITANAQPENIKKCHDCGMDYCLVKPINLDEVKKILFEYFTKRENDPF